MSILLDILEKQIVKTIDSFHGKAINDAAKSSMQKQVESHILNFCEQTNKHAPKPIILMSFERTAERKGKLHLVVEFLHPKEMTEMTLPEWEDEFEDGVTQ